MILRRVLICRVRLADLKETADLAAILNEVRSLEGACDRSEPSLSDVILIWWMIKELLEYWWSRYVLY